MDTLSCAFGQFQLSRFPARARDQLRAWDAADEYLLHHLAESATLAPQHRLLIVNDSFGALSTALAAHSPIMQSDSYLAHQGTLMNLEHNQINPSNVNLLSSLDTPPTPIDILIIKIPKTLAMLEDQLHRLRPHLHEHSVILGAAMAKHIHSSTLKLFESIIGPTSTSLAKKKARLIFCQLDNALSPPANPYPKRYTLDDPMITLVNHANVFSQTKLDIGSRFFLEHLPFTQGEVDIVDLGCGNGVLGVLAAIHNPNAKLAFVDESFMAVESAKINFHTTCPGREARFLVMDCLGDIKTNSVDFILNNPPFHQQHTVGDHIAWQMFSESRRCLRSGGRLYVIGNRHLGYHAKLKRLFGNCSQIASSKKFVIVEAQKR